MRPCLNTAVWFLGVIVATATLALAGPDKPRDKSARDGEDHGGTGNVKKVDVKGERGEKGDDSKHAADGRKGADGDKGTGTNKGDDAKKGPGAKQDGDGKDGSLTGRVEALERQIRDLAALVKQQVKQQAADAKKQPDQHDSDARPVQKKGDGK